jgi:tetratricopeptide (TPR) repeat protein
MKRTGIFIFFFASMLFILPPDCRAGTFPGNAKDDFSKGVSLYESRDYAKALEAFEKASQGPQSGNLFYNMGNCCLKLNDIGRAVLYYEKAKRLTPDDADLAHNLKYAQGFLKDTILPEQKNIFAKVPSYLDNAYSEKELTVLFLVLFLAAVLLSFVFFFFFPRFRWSAYFLCLLFFFSAGYPVQKAIEMKRMPMGVILPAVAQVRFGPNETVAFELHAGTKAVVLKERQDWYLIRLENGKTGYVEKKDLGMI